MVRILQNTIIFANNDEDLDNSDRECHIIKEKMRVLHQIMYFNVHNGRMLSCHFSRNYYFISITGKQNDANKHHLSHCLRVI